MNKFIPAKQDHYAEEGQSFNLQFAWMRKDKDNDFVQQHWWIKCRDFLGDAIWMSNNKDFKTRIYGFGINDKFEVQEYMGITFRFLPKEQRETYKANLKANLHLFSKWGPEVTVVLEDADDLVLAMPSFYQQAIWRVSLWSYLIKVLAYAGAKTEKNFLDKMDHKEEMYLMSIGKDRLLKVVNSLDKFQCKQYNEYKESYKVHNNEGFVSKFAAKARANTYSKQLDAMT